jgi:uncharacterized protein YrzB (UPF0473 family)
MEDKEIVVVLDKDGKEREAEIICAFTINEYKKDYILYTFNEKDENDMIKIYASTLVEKDDMYSYEAIATPEEWSTIKDIMRDMVQKAQNE